jgi:uncharacterized protein YhbP (UPF0306 family)
VTVRTHRARGRISDSRLRSIAQRLLDETPLCALATVRPDGRAHVNTMYFAWSDRFEIVWISAPDAQHSKNIRESATAAIAVYDSRQEWGGQDRGVQVFGSARELRGGAAAVAVALYARRFGSNDAIIRRFRPYRLRARTLKLFDERELGSGTFVTARVLAGGSLTWQRTDVYGDRGS